MLQNSPYLAYSNWEILNSYLYSATPSFVVPITAAVGLVGYFWFQNGQQAVNQLASQSIDAQAERIYLQYEVLAFAVREKLI